MIAFYLDEHLPLAAAVAGRDFGLDILAVVERDTRGWDDPAQLSLATSEGRVLVTRNYDDFNALARSWVLTDKMHVGNLFVPTSILENDFMALVRSLQEIATLYPDGLPPSSAMWLRPARN